MNLVDSSGWLEYFADGKNANFFAPAIEDSDNLIVSPINIYEVFKVISRQRDERLALQAVALMEQGKVINITGDIAISAAKISIDYQLPMADSLILATARMYESTLWTQDADFKGMPGVEYISK